MTSYAIINKIDIDSIKSNWKISSLFTIFLEFNHWDITRYIYDKKGYLEACVFHMKLAFKSLGISMETDNQTQKTNDKDN